MGLDPVCGMEVNPVSAEAQSEYEGVTFYFCSEECKKAERDRAVAQAERPRFAEAVAVARNGVDRVTPLVAGAPEDTVHLFLQHPLQELLHALPGEGFQGFPGRA